ncbi:peptidylprolyl isomerase [Kaistia dalseonensis]|uniref:Parvulin-like PPIase n=1 Tax=Kaistia dalseonensis TaxID=410840 RepID=A0ABU0H983_9HYPH|nr:peptidylprolyl isomerase [Kaistia dalseonensis]MCX5496222.1 peptidylprolyl isomerase [Kaistia dalseonensis]MDQ0438840.1 peptidyl-prolyl cis-trans isomerase C [Kaistia dalseonensis]
MATLVIDHAAASSHADQHPHEHGPAPVPTAPSPERVAMPAVSVNGVPISRKAIAAEVQNFPAPNPGEGWRAATRALVIRELLLQEAARLELAAEPATDAEGRVETREEALIRGLTEREITVPEADEVTLRRFYGNNRQRFTNAPLFEADHILLAARRDDAADFAAARQTATSLRARLLAGHEDFAALARAHSDCPSAALGGSLGQIGPGDTTAEFEAALVGLAPGAISEPVETRYGVHLIRLNRRVEGRVLPFEAVRDAIAAYLDAHVRRQATAQYIAILVGRADIRGIAMDGAASPLVQ